MSSSNQNNKVIGAQNHDIKYIDRQAVRTIIEHQGQIILIFVEKGQYFKLPGGGIEDDEDHHLAAVREALEETGCEVKIEGSCLGTVVEWRNDLHQTSFCYKGSLVNDTGHPDLTELERSEGLSHKWMTVKDAVQALRTAQPSSELGRYIQERDLYFIEEFIKAGTKSA